MKPKEKEKEAPKLGAVLEAAAKLRQLGGLATDPYARPYMPSESYARQLNARLGSQGALDHMANKAKAVDREAREGALASQVALERHARRVAKADAQRAERRRRMDPMQRLRDAWAALSVIPTAPAVSWEPPVHGGESESAGPGWQGDPLGEARVKVVRLAVELEGLVDEAKRRDLTRAA